MDYGPYVGVLNLLTFIMVLVIFLKVTGIV
jgi:hypothetical protein